MNADVFEAVCAMGDAARTAQSQLAQANTEAKNQLLNAIADAVLIGWPETDASDVITPDAAQLDDIDEQMRVMEQHIAKFSAMERDHDIVGMTDTLIRVTERVAGIRSIYQPDFPLPTFAEIRRVVQDEWDEDMDKIDPDNASPTADSIEQETADADKEQQAEKQAEQQADGAQKSGASA